MDPAANTAEIRRILTKEPNERDVNRLQELVEALSGWLASGGFTPEDTNALDAATSWLEEWAEWEVKTYAADTCLPDYWQGAPSEYVTLHTLVGNDTLVVEVLDGWIEDLDNCDPYDVPEAHAARIQARLEEERRAVEPDALWRASLPEPAEDSDSYAYIALRVLED